MWLGEARARAWREAKSALLRPIIYLRGYAMTDGEIETTSEDPFNGFNIGSMHLRTGWTGEAARHVFESPVLRLTQPPYGYRVVFSTGIRGLDQETKERLRDWHETGQRDANGAPPPPPALLAIYRYYDTVARDFDGGRRPGMETYAWGLGRLVHDILEATRADGVYLVAHSMGGLVARAFLQNAEVPDGSAFPADESPERFRPVADLLAQQPHLRLSQAEWDAARGKVKRLFTYGTPHNGISARGGIGNALLGPLRLAGIELDNFDRRRMLEFLADPPQANSLGGRFPVENAFTLVGTAAADYPAAGGMARRLVGELSDGLVELDNAVVHGPGPQGGTVLAARAYVRRAHSGPFGMVNSEEGFGNLSRFLYGDVRVEGDLVVRHIGLPPALEQRREDAHRAGRSAGIRASYAFEVFLRVRGARWALTERLARDGSAVFRTYADLFEAADGERHRHVGLFDAFLDTQMRTLDRAEQVENGERSLKETLGFAVRVRAAVPEYEVDRLAFLQSHYEGSTLVDRDLVFLVFPDPQAPGGWGLAWGMNPADSRSMKVVTQSVAAAPGAVTNRAVRRVADGAVEYWIPVTDDRPPSFRAWLRLTARPWNKPHG